MSVKTGEDHWDEIDIESVLVAVGLYLPVINSAKECFSDIPEELQNKNGKGAIFVCPERVDEWSKKIGITFINSGIKQDIFGTLFQKVAIHELAHAFMDRGQNKWNEYLNNPCYRIVEESLANAVLYTHFNPVESVTVSKAISEQPLEYRGYVYWLDSRFWRNYDDFFWRHERDIFLNPINPKGAIKILASWWKRNYRETDEIMRIAESVVETII